MISRCGQEQNLSVTDKNIIFSHKKAEKPAFKGWGSSFFSMIQTHEVAGPTVVNISAMVIPRTTVDFTRSDEAGIETARREVTSLISSSLLPGFYAIGAGCLLGLLSNQPISHSILMTNNDIVDVLKKNWEDALKQGGNKEEILLKALNRTISGAKALTGDSEKFISAQVSEEIAQEIKELLENKENLSRKEKKERLNALFKKAVELTGAEKQVKIFLEGKTGKKTVETTMKNFIGDLYHISNEFLLKYESPSRVNDAIEKFKSLSRLKGIAGFSIAVAIALSTQFINRYITQQKTGTSAFVGLPDYEKIAEHKVKKEEQKPSKLKLTVEKALSVLAMGYMLGATYASSLNPKKVLESLSSLDKLSDKLKFRGKFVTLNQLRALSAITISGRILASDDVNELRETNTRDFLGFLNWLVLGGFVANLTANALESKNTLEGNKILNEKEAFKGGGWLKHKFHIIKNTLLKTDGEIDAMNITYKVKQKLKTNKNIAIAAGLLYSVITLGFGVTLFNKYLTNKVARQKNPEAEALPKNNEFNRKTFNKNLLLVEETLGSLRYNNSVSSQFFNLPPKESVFDKLYSTKKN